MSEKKLRITVPYDVALNPEPNSIVVYGILQWMYRPDNGDIIVIPDSIGFKLGYKLPMNTKSKKRIIDGLECLYELGYVKKRDKFYFVDTNAFYNCQTGFVYCDLLSFQKLMNDPGLLQHYLLIKRGLINGKCTFSLTYFAKKENISIRTVSRRNAELEDKKLIIVYQDSYKPDQNGRNNNVYTLYSDEQANKKRSSYSDLNRSVSARYNAFVKNPGKYSPLQKKTLRQEVIEYNERNPARIKDTSVFD